MSFSFKHFKMLPKEKYLHSAISTIILKIFAATKKLFKKPS